jgi:hypothetical protein
MMLDCWVMAAVGLWIARSLYKTFIEPGWKKSQTYKNWRKS